MQPKNTELVCLEGLPQRAFLAQAQSRGMDPQWSCSSLDCKYPPALLLKGKARKRVRKGCVMSLLNMSGVTKMYMKTETGCPAKEVWAPFVLGKRAGVGSLRDPHAPCFPVPGCRSSLQKVLAEWGVFLIPLPQGFGFTSPGESNNCFVTPKLEVPAIHHALCQHTVPLCISG